MDTFAKSESTPKKLRRPTTPTIPKQPVARIEENLEPTAVWLDEDKGKYKGEDKGQDANENKDGA